jgi:hypothetical protein
MFTIPSQALTFSRLVNESSLRSPTLLNPEKMAQESIDLQLLRNTFSLLKLERRKARCFADTARVAQIEREAAIAA